MNLTSFFQFLLGCFH